MAAAFVPTHQGSFDEAQAWAIMVLAFRSASASRAAVLVCEGWVRYFADSAMEEAIDRLGSGPLAACHRVDDNAEGLDRFRYSTPC